MDNNVPLTLTVLALLALALIIAAFVLALRDARHADVVPQTAALPNVAVDRGTVQVRRPPGEGVEGLEILYGASGLVRSVRVGAMNVEHKELLLTMDDAGWRAMANAQKQEVLAAARSTWASKMCSCGTDVAYVVVKTERGEVVGRASPRTMTIV